MEMFAPDLTEKICILGPVRLILGHSNNLCHTSGDNMISAISLGGRSCMAPGLSVGRM